MLRLDLPDEPTNELKLADWLEILALNSSDENSSRGDLERALTTASVLDHSGPEAVEKKCLQVFSELEQRAIAAAEAYPFQIEGAVLSARPDRKTYSGYIFCLYLSYFRWKAARTREVNIDPWLLFEDYCRIAAEQFVKGKAINFGAARGSAFRERINDLSSRLGEGGGFREQPVRGIKDDKVDLVAWKDFADKLPSKLVLFGQCAAGDDWTTKISDLDPQPFWDQWMAEGKVSMLLRSFYIPGRIRRESWEHRARYAGILFDRCRISYWAFQDNAAVISDKRYAQWSRFVLRTDLVKKRATGAGKKLAGKSATKRRKKTRHS